MRSHLVHGKVKHRRSRPFVYNLEHDVFYFALDLSEIDAVAKRLKLVSRNRWNIFSFRDADHWVAPASDLEASVHAHLQAEGWDTEGWRITLITNLRNLGHVFNPASFYLCRDASGEMAAVVTEVHNTHGDRILYTLRPDTRGTVHTADMPKEMYVSPFISMDAHYTLRVRDGADRLQIVINQTEHGEPMLQASMALKRTPLTDTSLLRMLVRYPMVTLKTIAMIHVHAFFLWRKGAKFHSHGAAPAPRQPKPVTQAR
ncbi:MAG TPA: DUF1365 domain-containing protein [Candidatus Limnocylindrales bacterium]|nr:DUF1365 domain-containing protein [Candidatus Limnocylindrales bacterium]